MAEMVEQKGGSVRRRITSFHGEYFFLSNFYASPVIYDLEVYPTAEHAFQAAKTHSLKERKQIALCLSPGMAKRKGQEVILRLDWDLVKLQIMRDIVQFKFSHHIPLRDKLLKTGNAELVEGNSWGDTFWGVSNGVGHNYLGEILMRVRKDLGGE